MVIICFKFITVCFSSNGANTIYIQASNGMFLSETYGIEDCSDYDSCTSSNAKWTFENQNTVSYSSNGMKAIKTGNIDYNHTFSSPYSIEFTLVDYYSPSAGYEPVVVSGNSGNHFYGGDGTNKISLFDGRQVIYHEIIKGAVYKIECTASNVFVYENGTLLGSESCSGLYTIFKFWVGAYNNRMMEIKDFKVKPL